MVFNLKAFYRYIFGCNLKPFVQHLILKLLEFYDLFCA